jgi:uncharacterized protein YbaR (Trm112 family)
MALPADLLSILRCPESRQPLVYFEAEGFLLCPASKRKYRIEDGIPVMLVDEAEKLGDAECERLVAEARRRGLPNA